MKGLPSAILIYLFILMVNCYACGAANLTEGRGMSNHRLKCKGIQAMHTQGVQHAAQQQAAAAVAAAAVPPPENIVVSVNLLTLFSYGIPNSIPGG